jgi:hypothetical protein
MIGMIWQRECYYQRKRENVHQASYPSMEEAVCLLEDGNLQHAPNITHARAFEMYATPSFTKLKSSGADEGRSPSTALWNHE